MRVDDALKAVALDRDRPLVVPLHGAPKEMVEAACAVTRGRLDLRDQAREDKTIGGLKDFDPPHLTCYEQAAFTLCMLADEADRAFLLALQDMGGAVVTDRPDGKTTVVSLNLSHIRQLHARPGFELLGRSLADVVRERVDVCLDDIPVFPGMCAQWELDEVDLSPAERRRHLRRSFLIRMSRAGLDQLVTHRELSKDTRSQRVVDECKDGIGMVWSPRGDPGNFGEPWSTTYETLRAERWPSQDARYALPMATATVSIVSSHMRGWRDFLWKRGQPKVQEEVRYVAWQIREALAADCPDCVEGVTVSDRKIEGWLRADLDEAAERRDVGETA